MSDDIQARIYHFAMIKDRADQERRREEFEKKFQKFEAEKAAARAEAEKAESAARRAALEAELKPRYLRAGGTEEDWRRDGPDLIRAAVVAEMEHVRAATKAHAARSMGF
jgi:hypothetical protein